MAAVDFHGDADLCGHALFVDSFRDPLHAIQSAVILALPNSFRYLGHQPAEHYIGHHDKACQSNLAKAKTTGEKSQTTGPRLRQQTRRTGYAGVGQDV